MKKSSQLYAVWCVCMAHPFLQCNCNGAHWRTQLSILINLAVIRCDIQTKIYEHHHHPYGELEAISFTHCFNISIVRIEVSHISKVKNIYWLYPQPHTPKHWLRIPKTKYGRDIVRSCALPCLFLSYTFGHLRPKPHTVSCYCLYLQIATEMCFFLLHFHFHSFLFVFCLSLKGHR